MGVLTDLSLIKANAELFSFLQTVMGTTCSPRLVEIFNKLSLLVPDFNKDVSFYKLPLKDSFTEALDFNFKIKTQSFGLGQLSTKEEAAGKMRVFAMVDL